LPARLDMIVHGVSQKLSLIPRIVYPTQQLLAHLRHVPSACVRGSEILHVNDYMLDYLLLAKPIAIGVDCKVRDIELVYDIHHRNNRPRGLSFTI
jgi:hypothetical protein